LIQERSPHDKRAVRIKLSEKGLALCENIDRFMERAVVHMQSAGIDSDGLAHTNKSLRLIERLLGDILSDIF